jgi:hypothetical protein
MSALGVAVTKEGAQFPTERNAAQVKQMPAIPSTAIVLHLVARCPYSSTPKTCP